MGTSPKGESRRSNSGFSRIRKGRHPRYGRPIDGRDDNDEVQMEYGPIEMARNGYSSYEEERCTWRMRTRTE